MIGHWASKRRPLSWSVILAMMVGSSAVGSCSRKTSPEQNASRKTGSLPGTPATGSTTPAGSAQKAQAQQKARTAENRPARPAARRTTARGSQVQRRAEYRLTLMGKEVGRLVQEEIVSSDRIRTLERATISMQRGSASIHMSIESHTEERRDGTPISFSVLLDQGSVKIQSKGRYEKGKLLVEDQSGKREVPYDSKWLFPAAAERRILATGFAKGRVEFFQFDPLMGMTGKKVTVEILGDKQIHWSGKEVTCHELRMTLAGMSPTTACVDNENLAYESTMSFGAIALHLTLLSKTHQAKAHGAMTSNLGKDHRPSL